MTLQPIAESGLLATSCLACLTGRRACTHPGRDQYAMVARQQAAAPASRVADPDLPGYYAGSPGYPSI